MALQLVKRACERPDQLGRSLSQWECVELARQLERDGIVARLSAATVRRMLSSQQLQPWRHPLWLSPTVPHDAAFAQTVLDSVDRYSRPRGAQELVLCVDEKTSLQPRTRTSPTRPAQPGRPVQVEPDYERKGALNLVAACDTRTGKVYGHTAERKRQQEFSAFLELLNRDIPAASTASHGVLDNLRMHKGQQVQAWLAKHPRFVFHHPPVPGSWLNQIEQWFSILPRKRLAIADFADKTEGAERLQAYIKAWNAVAQPFQWSTKAVTKIMAKRGQTLPKDTPVAQAACDSVYSALLL